MNKFIKKSVAIGLASIMTLGSVSVTALANSDIVNSNGSVNNDVSNITSGDNSSEYSFKPNGVIGYDDSQDKASEYKSVDGTTDQDSEVNVYATQEESAEVIIPKTIILDGTNTTAAGYKVKVKGNISGESVVRAVPESNESVVNAQGPSYTGSAKAHFYLGSKGKKDVIAEVNQEKDSFYWNDVKDLAENEWSETTGTVESNISAGMWHGNFNFNVELGKLSEEEMLSSKYRKLYSVDLSATNNDDVQAFYLVPNEHTQEVQGSGSNSHGKSLVSKIKAAISPMVVYADEQVVTRDGIEYRISDDDVLIIQGSGKIKDRIVDDLSELESFRIGVVNEFDDCTRTNSPIYRGYINNIEDNNKLNVLYWSGNNMYPSVYGRTSTSSTNAQYVGTISANGVSADAGPAGAAPADFVNLCNRIKAYIDANKDDVVTHVPSKVVISNGVNEIGTGTFSSYSALEELTIPKSVKKPGTVPGNCKVYIEDLETYLDFEQPTSNTFTRGYNNPFKDVYVGGIPLDSIENITIPNGKTKIGDYTFYGMTNLKSISVPSTVTEIGKYAFSHTNISALPSLENISSVGEYAFVSCPFTNVNISKISSIPNGMFQSCNKLETVTIGDSVTSIGDNAFNECRALKNISISNNVTSIGRNAFRDCWKLEEIILPNSLTTVGQYAFSSCESLKSLKFPSGITTLSIPVSGSTSLSYVEIPGSVETISGSNPFGNMTSNSTICCETQAVADLLSGKYNTSKTKVIVDASKF